jgi:hypothetical protein
MPKWLIILAVVFLIILLGCCGGFVACRWACAKAVTAGEAAAQKAEEAASRAAEEAGRRATQPEGGGPVTVGGGGGAIGGAGVDGGGGGNPGAGGGAAPGGGNGGGGNGITSGLGSGNMPANFPKDIPVMAGLAPSGVSFADKTKGSGMIALTGTGKRTDAAAYYEKQMADQGWAPGQNVDIGDSTSMTFTKDNRQATIQAVQDGNKVMVNIIYETKN